MNQLFNNIKWFFKYLSKGSIKIGHHFWTCPFKYWISACLYWKRPKLKFYLGRIGNKVTGVYDHDSEILDKDGQPIFKKDDPIITQCGIWPFVTWKYLEWYMPKWCQKYFPLTVISRSVSWKDKYNTPRYERAGIFTIIWGIDINKAWQFCMLVKAPEVYADISEEDKEKLKDSENSDWLLKLHDDDYWETMLWYTNYAGKNFEEAYRTWPNGNWSTTVKIGEDEDGNPISASINLGPSWNPGFFTKRGLKKMEKVKQEEIKNSKYNLKV